jgi:hypothetical protein
MNYGQFTNRERLNLSQVISGIKANYPDFLKFYCRRRYKNVERFHDYRMVTAMLCACACTATSLSMRAYKETSELGLIAAIGAKNDFPTYFVERDMFFAASATTPPNEIDWLTMHLPFDYMTFVLPKNTIRMKGEEICCIQFTRGVKGNYFFPKANLPVVLANDYLMIDAYTESGMRLMRHHTKLYVPNLEYKNVAESVYESGLDGEESEILETLVQTVFNLIFAMAARPEYIESGHKIGNHKKSNSEIWTPNIIGRKYAVKKDLNCETGTHASPRMHWRRGHFRQQAFGKGLTEHKIIWIEPMLVGLKEKVKGKTV